MVDACTQYLRGRGGGNFLTSFKPRFDDLQDAIPNSVDSPRLQVLVDTLAKTTFQAAEHRRVFRITAREGSRAAWEMKQGLALSEDYANLTFSLPSLLVLTAEDHLNCLRLAVQRAGMYGAAALARAVLETSARAWWHFDPDITSRERTRRAMAEYLYDCWQYLQLEKTMNPPEEQATAKEKLSTATADAIALGFLVETKDGGRYQLVDEEARPGTGTLIRDLLDAVVPADVGRFAWRQLSGTSHGALHAVIQGRMMGEHPLEKAVQALVPHVQTGDLEWPVTVACMGFGEAFLRMATLYGWDAAYWEKWNQEMLATLITGRGGWPVDTGTG